MTLKQKWSELTEEGCNKILGTLHSLDRGITIGECIDFATQRKATATERELKRLRDLIDKVQGKCFRIDFGNQHVTLLRITEIAPVLEFGFPDGIMEGDTLTNYKGQISLESLSGKKYGDYFPNDSCIEITEFEFCSQVAIFKQINF